MSWKKRWIAGLLSVVFSFLMSFPAAAVGDGNVDGSGGGNLGSGTKANQWKGDDGVRISVVTLNGNRVACFDWSNYSGSDVIVSFVRRNKIEYQHGYSLSLATRYVNHKPDVPLPKIVSGNGTTNIAAVKRYFTDVGRVRSIAAQAGLSYEELIGGDYKLLLEPMAYFYSSGIKIAATATEASLYNTQTGGLHLPSLIRQNLPLSMYLERSDTGLGLYKWDGPKSGKQDPINIFRYLGMGIVTFKPPEDPVVSEFDYEFRTDTDVIVAVTLHNPGDNVTRYQSGQVTFQINGDTIRKDYECPGGGEQLVWVPWHTPSEPTSFTATVTGSGGGSAQIRINVTKLVENPPPDPTFYDEASGWQLPEAPDYGTNTRTIWGEWYWVQNHGIHIIPGPIPLPYVCSGYCEEHGYWRYANYSARLEMRMEISPDDRCPTDYVGSNNKTVMKSGYGIQSAVRTVVVAETGGVDRSDITPVQNVLATFPEFNYETYDRFYESTNGSQWTLQENPFSLYRSRVHFTPLWYPDDTDYVVDAVAFDAWTPGGHLYATMTDALYIYQSCLDDWYIHNTP